MMKMNPISTRLTFALGIFVMFVMFGTFGKQSLLVMAADRPPASASKPPAAYVKVILPMKAPADGKKPVIEPWLLKKLKKLDKGDFRAVTGWVRLAEGNDETTPVWDTKLDGKWWGCPVSGDAYRSSDGKLNVSVSGWSPVGGIVEATFSNPTAGSLSIGTIQFEEDKIAAIAVIHIGSPPK